MRRWLLPHVCSALSVRTDSFAFGSRNLNKYTFIAVVEACNVRDNLTMSYPEFFLFNAAQQATIAPANLTFFDQYPQYPEVQDGAIEQFSHMAVDPMVGFGSTSDVDFTGWSWPDSLDMTQSQPPLQHDHSQMHTVPIAVTGEIPTTSSDPLTQAFDYNTVHQLAAQDGWTAPEPRARPNESGTMDKVEDLMVMILDLRTKTDQRMNTIEEEIKAVKSR